MPIARKNFPSQEEADRDRQGGRPAEGQEYPKSGEQKNSKKKSADEDSDDDESDDIDSEVSPQASHGEQSTSGDESETPAPTSEEAGRYFNRASLLPVLVLVSVFAGIAIRR